MNPWIYHILRAATFCLCLTLTLSSVYTSSAVGCPETGGQLFVHQFRIVNLTCIEVGTRTVNKTGSPHKADLPMTSSESEDNKLSLSRPFMLSSPSGPNLSVENPFGSLTCQSPLLSAIHLQTHNSFTGVGPQDGRLPSYRQVFGLAIG